MKKIEQDISQRISILRFVMIFGIVVLHTPPYVSLTETDHTLFAFIKAFFQHAVFRTSVPVLTCISGYLLFKSQLHNKFLQLFYKKTKTILIPLALFNIPIVIIVWYLQFKQLGNHSFEMQIYPFDLKAWLDASIGLTRAPINYPLNFLRDLYIISIMAPIFSILLIKIPKIGLIIVSIFFLLNYDGDLVLRNLMPLMFYLGGFLALYNINIRALDKYGVYLLVLFIALCTAIVILKIENRNYLRLVSPFLIWPAASLIINTNFGKWLAKLAKYSFPIFLIQGPILFICWLIYKKYLLFLPYWLFWVITPIATAIFLITLYRIGLFTFPKITRFAFGGR